MLHPPVQRQFLRSPSEGRASPFLAPALEAITPLSFPGLVGWWKADSFNLADGTEILTAGRVWVDSSGNGNDGTNGGQASWTPEFHTNQVNGKPAITTNGAEACALTNPINLGVNNWTLIVVFASPSPGGSGCGLIGGGTPNNIALFWGDAGPHRMHFWSTSGFAADNGSANFATPANSPVMATLRLQAGQVAWYENITGRTVSATPPSPVGGSYILSHLLTDANTFSFMAGGLFLEAAVYNNALADAKIASLYNGYVKPKYGLA